MTAWTPTKESYPAPEPRLRDPRDDRDKTGLAQALVSPRRKLGLTHPGEMLRAEFMELRVARKGMDAELDAVAPLAA